MTASVWWTRALRLSSFLPLLFFAFVLATRLDDVEYAYGAPVRRAGDFNYLRGAAQTLRTDQPEALYEGVADRDAWRREHGFKLPGGFPYAPAVAVALLPLTLVGASTAFTVWKVGVALASLALGLATAQQFRSRLWQAAAVLAAMTWWPLLLNARIGQTGAFVAALIALGALLFLSRRERGAGVLALCVLKPSTVLGPALIVWPERPRVWLVFAAVAAAVALLPFLFLGPDSLLGWIDNLRGAARRDLGGGHSYDRGLSNLVPFTGVAGRLLLIALVIGAMALVQVLRQRGGAAAAAAVAVLAGALLNPHSLVYEWGTAFVAVLLIRRSLADDALWADSACGLLLLSLYLLGNWDLHDPPAQPLTAWALATGAGFSLFTFWRSRRRHGGLTLAAA